MALVPTSSSNFVRLDEELSLISMMSGGQVISRWSVVEVRLIYDDGYASE